MFRHVTNDSLIIIIIIIIIIVIFYWCIICGYDERGLTSKRNNRRKRMEGKRVRGRQRQK